MTQPLVSSSYSLSFFLINGWKVNECFFITLSSITKVDKKITWKFRNKKLCYIFYSFLHSTAQEIKQRNVIQTVDTQSTQRTQGLGSKDRFISKWSLQSLTSLWRKEFKVTANQILNKRAPDRTREEIFLSFFPSFLLFLSSFFLFSSFFFSLPYSLSFFFILKLFFC